MKITTICATTLSIFLNISVVFAENSEEIAKIDKRLEELKLIWNQEQAVINGYTKNRTVPVQQGSKAHQACLEASQRINLATQEAAKLKAKRKEIESSGEKVDGELTIPNEQMEIREFNVQATKEKADLQKNKTLVFKGFYLGMPGSDALGLLNHYMNYPQASEKHVKPPEDQNAAVAGAFAEIFENAGMGGLAESQLGLKDPFQIVILGDQLVIAKRLSATRYFALLDKDGKVIEFKIRPDIRDKFFGSNGTPFAEFMKTFITQYGIPSLNREQIRLNYPNEDIGWQEKYSHRDPKGYELIFWGEASVLDSSKKMLAQEGEEGEIRVIKIKSEEERKNGFD